MKSANPPYDHVRLRAVIAAPAPPKRATATSSRSCRPRWRSWKRRRRRSAARSARPSSLLFVRGARLGVPRHDRHRRVGAGQDRPERPHQNRSSRSRPASCARSTSTTARRVKAGDVLIELDPTINAAELDHLQSDLLAAQLDVARLQRGAGRAATTAVADFKPPAEAHARSWSSTQRQLPAEPDRRAARQARRARPTAGAEGSRAARRSRPPSTSSRRSFRCSQERVDIRKTLVTTRNWARSSSTSRCCRR